MFANYLPATYLELGDYGNITNDGEFIRSGNIFKDHSSLRDAVEPGREEIGSNKHFFASRNRRNTGVSIITASVPLPSYIYTFMSPEKPILMYAF
jgi:hypothetical protein